MKHPLIPISFVGLFLLLSTSMQGQEQLLKRMIKSKPVQAKNVVSKSSLPKGIKIAVDGSQPAIADFDPKVGGEGTIITITGTNFNDGTVVAIGGVVMKECTLVNGSTLSVILGGKVSGKISVTGGGTTSTSTDDLTYAMPPVISEINIKKPDAGDELIITGENFIGEVEVWIDGVKQDENVKSETVIELTVKGPVGKGLIIVKTPGGKTSYGGNTPFDADANITIPLQGQGINIIPTPTFSFTQAHNGKCFGFMLSVWGNTLGTDSSLKKVVSNLLVPQISLLGFKTDLMWRIPTGEDWSLAIALQSNVLLKKVSFYDTSSKAISSFNPFVFHPKAGVAASVYKNFFIGCYMNMFSVVTENEEFKTFFGSKKSTFVYPNLNLGGIFDFKGGNQSLKVEFDFVIHNGETRMLLPTKDKVIPYLKVALLSNL